MKEKFQLFLQKIKGSIRSKTIWFNALIATLIPILPDLLNSIPDLQPYLPADMYKTLTLIGLLGNMYLRFKTNKSLEHK